MNADDLTPESPPAGVPDTEEFLSPEFIDMKDAVEVQVNDDDVPMEDDDDDPDDDDASETAPPMLNEMIHDNETLGSQLQPTQDMAKIKAETHTDSVYSVASFVENGQLSILSGGGDDRAFLHKITGGDTPVVVSKQLPYPHTDTVSCVAFNVRYVSDDLKKTPRLAATGGYDGAIVIYDPDTGEQKLKLEGPSDVEWLCFHPKGGSVILAGSGDGTVWMYHIPLNRCLQVFVGHEQAVTAGSFSPDGKFALSASADGTLRVWAPKTGMSRHVFRTGDAGLTCLACNGGSDGMLVIVGTEDGQAHICHIGSKKIVTSLRHFEAPAGIPDNDDEEIEYPMSVEAVGFSPLHPNWCATAGVDGKLKIWDLDKGGMCRQTCLPAIGDEEKGPDTITRLFWHKTLPVVFTSSISGMIRLWDARNGRLLNELSGHTEMINDIDIQFLGNGTAVIVSGGDDKSVRTFEVDVNLILQRGATS